MVFTQSTAVYTSWNFQRTISARMTRIAPVTIVLLESGLGIRAFRHRAVLDEKLKCEIEANQGRANAKVRKRITDEGSGCEPLRA